MLMLRRSSRAAFRVIMLQPDLEMAFLGLQ